MTKRILAAMLCFSLCAGSLAMTGCQKSDDKSSDTSASGTEDAESADSSEAGILNYTAPAEGEEIVVISVKDRGDIKIKLFPDLMPEACDNFTTHAKEGYYDELIFHRVIDDFMIQGGDPMGSGTGGEPIEKYKDVDMGTTDKLCHVIGAVAYANSGATSTNGSQFYIVTGNQPEEMTDDYFSAYAPNLSEEKKKLYQENGGSPYLDGSYTVFGQVIDGLDIAYDIAATTDKDGNDKPYESIVMESVKVEKYDGFEIKSKKSDYSSLK